MEKDEKTYRRIICLPVECKQCGTSNWVRIPFELTKIELEKVKKAKIEVK